MAFGWEMKSGLLMSNYGGEEGREESDSIQGEVSVSVSVSMSVTPTIYKGRNKSGLEQ